MSPDRPVGFAPENEPRPVGGVEIVIPSIEYLHEFAVNTANRNGDLTSEELKSEYIDFFLGMGKQPGTLIWDVEMVERLIDRGRVELFAGYSAEEGRWADLVSSWWFSDVLHSWDAADKAAEIVKILEKNEPEVHLVESSGEKNIYIGNEESGVVVLYLGHIDFKRAEEVFSREWAQENGNNPIVITPKENLGLDKEGFFKTVERYQEVAPKVITAIYEAFGEKVPRVRVELLRNDGD